MKRLVYPSTLLGTDNDFNNIIKLNIIKVEPGDMSALSGTRADPSKGEVGDRKGRSSFQETYDNTPKTSYAPAGVTPEYQNILDAGQDTYRLGRAGATYIGERAQVEVKLTEETRSTHTEIYLPAPAMIPFGNRSNYSGQPLGGFNNLAGQKFMDVAKAGWNDLMRGQAPTELIKLAKDILAPTIDNVSSLGSNELKSTIESRLRAIRNPHMKVLYEGPEFRTFNLTSPMVPFNAKDSETIREIIKVIEEASAPDYANRYNGFFGTDNWFSFPDEFEIQIMMKDPETGNLVENPYVQKIRRCVLTSREVNYGGNSVFSTHRSGAPLEVVMQLSFLETEYLTKSVVENDFYPGDNLRDPAGSTGVSNESSGLGGVAPVQSPGFNLGPDLREP